MLRAASGERDNQARAQTEQFGGMLQAIIRKPLWVWEWAQSVKFILHNIMTDESDASTHVKAASGSIHLSSSSGEWRQEGP